MSAQKEVVMSPNDLLNDPKFKKYALAVEKCLTTFDNVHEWADFIAFLTKLLKTFQSFMQFKEIPKKLIVAKRLAQCLNPALPTGVHQRALDVYAHVLAVLGPAGLKRDLPLWSSGLFPFFEYAATSVKPTLLNLYSTHYLPLQQGLRPVMKAFVVALLPGLEEETGEFFDKVLSLLDKLSETVTPAFFFQNIWLVLLTTPPARGSALNYLSRRLPNLNSETDLTSVVGRDIGLMVRALAATLEDEHLLVKRGVLEILHQSLRMDGFAFKKTQQEDRKILMKAAMSVVLRRDLSLNRRLYTWLVGSLDESSDAQISYLRSNSLDLLSSTLRDELFAPVSESGGVRPYKIFISFLDKWEVGSPLTEVLIIDAFRAVHRLNSQESTSDGTLNSEMVVAASNVYERVEPQIVWKQLSLAMLSHVQSAEGTTEVLDTTRLVLTVFTNHDDEAQRVYVPLFFVVILDVIRKLIKADHKRMRSDRTPSALSLLRSALDIVPTGALVKWEDFGSEGLPIAPRARAAQLYGLSDDEFSSEADVGASTPFSSAFLSLVELSTVCADALSKDGNVFEIRECLLSVFSLLFALVSRIGPESKTRLEVTWDPAEWLSLMLASLNLDTSFEVLDEFIRLLVGIIDSPCLRPRLILEERAVIAKVILPLFHFLGPDMVPYHARAVQWFWVIHSHTQHYHVESIVAETLTVPEAKYNFEAFEAFGVLWRLTDDALFPGFRLRVPMLVVLDSLRSDNPGLRRVGETWMRGSLKSYLRVLDPILFDLITAKIIRTPVAASFQGRTIRGFTYERPFDQHSILYTLENLLAVVRFGGQGLVKVTRSTLLKRSLYPELNSLAEHASVAHPGATYIDTLVEIFLTFLQSEPKAVLHAQMSAYNLRIQSVVVELLQALVARGELDLATLETIESVIISRLYAAVHTQKLDLQNKFLHVLHSVIFAVNSLAPSRQDPKGSDNEAGGSSSFPISSNPLLVQALIDGLSKPSNRAVIQHWIDFVQMTVVQYRSLSHLIVPVTDCLCRQLRLCLTDVLQVLAYNGKGKGPASSTTDADMILMLNAVERLVLISLSKSDDPDSMEDEVGPSEKTGGEASTGILNYVFGTESTTNVGEDHVSTRSPGFRSLHDAVRVLHSIWTSTAELSNPRSSAITQSLSLVHSKVRTRCQKLLEHFFKVQPAEVLETIVECCIFPSSDALTSTNLITITINMIDSLAPDAQTVVQMLCESIVSRVVPSLDRNKKATLNQNLSDSSFFLFLENYLQRLEGPIAVQVWGRFVPLAKEVAGNVHSYKFQIFPLLRCTTVLSERLTQTSALEDRRLRKELQDIYIKLVDTCILIAGRAFEQGNWIRRSTKDAVISSGRASPAIPDPLENSSDDKVGPATDSTKPSGPDLIEQLLQINQYLVLKSIPNLRRFLVDSDKVTSVCNNVVYYIVNPSIKQRSSNARSLDVDIVMLDILGEMVKIPSSIRVWRPVISDSFNDNRFFNSAPSLTQKWRPLVKALMDADRATFTDLIGRMTAAPSSNIFANRETEMLQRSLNLRRLSYVLFTGEKNHFLTQLPAIQEKLVDILRTNSVVPIILSEVYLCMRVLLCRLSPHNLNSFWPVILTELFRTFEQVLTAPPADGSDELVLVLSACKFLDMLVVLQTEEFQVHQWMFVTDTVDAIYRPDNWQPESLMDQLEKVIRDMPDDRAKDGASPSTNGYHDGISVLARSKNPLRRPLLGKTRNVESIKDLLSFFSHISIFSYESTYAGGFVDWDAVESSLLEDLFDGERRDQ